MLSNQFSDDDEEEDPTVNDSNRIGPKVHGTITVVRVPIYLKAIKCVILSSDIEVKFSTGGMKVIAEISKYFQASVIFMTDFFETFMFFKKNHVMSYGMNLNNLVNVLSIMNESSDKIRMELFHQNDHLPLKFVFYDDEDEETEEETVGENIKYESVFTECYIRVKNSTNPINFVITEEEKCSHMVTSTMHAAFLLNEFDKDIDEIKITVDKKNTTFETVGHHQLETKIVIERGQIFTRFEFVKGTSFIYKLSNLKSVEKGMQFGDSVSMTFSSFGILKIQIMTINEDSVLPLFFEYTLLPMCSEDDDC
ncbi:hypothetical protein PVAND_012824 [Polypedilum vanderplanki]|uniref:Uncharacterized protein n=1 Tax=Polypedilum vanderplanki TaxID=319348 RepID=A0A9J6CPM5_POLVA|nr:hypothetical protein PVAND_012824 [Polypedilum vanderplanki]